MSASRAIRPHPFTVSRRAILAGGTVSAPTVLAACSSNSASQEASPAASGGTSTGSGSAKSLPRGTVVPAELGSGLGSGQTDGIFPRTVVHYQGGTTINATPTKVVAISTGRADAMLTFGICPVGSTIASDAEGPVSQYLEDVYPSQISTIEAITKVGPRNEPNIEAIGALEPDLILTNIADKDDIDTLRKDLTAIAPTIVIHDTGQFWRTDFLLLTDALGRREATQSLLDTLKKGTAEAGSALSFAGAVSLLRKNNDKLQIFGPISSAGSVIANMGLQYPNTQQFTNGVSNEPSSEALDQVDDDWLFYGIQGDKDEKLTGQALWGSLKAVSAGHAVKVDDDPFFLNAGPITTRIVRGQIIKAV